MAKIHLVWIGFLFVGCGQYPNPNDLAAVRSEQRVEIANKRLESAEETLDYKVRTKEITDSRRNELIQELAEDLLKKVDPQTVPQSDQWRYAVLLRVTNRWPEAEAALAIAVKAANTDDRKVNDTLKLALAEAKNNKVAEAIVTASSILGVGDADAAPILPAVLYEIVPAAQGKGHDKDLANLVGKAIECQRRVKVDPASDAGKMFMIASSQHISNAEAKISELAGSKN